MDKENEVKRKRVKKRKPKKIVLIIGGVTLIVVIVIACILLIGDNEKKLTKELENMGVTFYEDYFYDMIKDRYKDDEKGFKEYLAEYQEQGFKVDLENLAVTNNTKDKLDDFINSKTKEKCDKNKTVVVIHPKEDYGKTDYTMDITLVCGFEENK